MNITTAIVEVRKAAQAGLPVLLLGSPGVGKTTIGYALAEALHLPYVEVRPAEFESVDFRGIPTVENGRTKWNVPDFWPTQACLLNVDEITQAPMELTSPLLKLFLGGQIGDYRLPEGTVLMATGNQVSDRAGCSRLSSALRERCVVIHIEPDLGEWSRWYEVQEHYDHGLLCFLQQHPALFHRWDSKQDCNQPTPRNWARVSRLLPHEPAVETLAGIIGPEVAGCFSAWRRANVELPNLDDIIEGRAKLPTSPAQLSRIAEQLPMAAAARAARGDYQAIALVERMDGTWQVQFLKSLSSQAGHMLKRPEVQRLIARHAAAIVASR